MISQDSLIYFNLCLYYIFCGLVCACCLTRLFPCDRGGGHSVVLGSRVIAIVSSDSGGAGLDARIQAIHCPLPVFHLRHAAITLTHCRARREEVSKVLDPISLSLINIKWGYFSSTVNQFFTSMPHEVTCFTELTFHHNFHIKEVPLIYENSWK